MPQAMDGVPDEASLICERRKAAIPRMSHRTAAARAAKLSDASFSASTWQKIERGDYAGGPDRVAIMALVVGVSPDELETAGRPDAARLLRMEIERRAESDPTLAGADLGETSEAVVQLLLQGLNEIRQEPHLTPRQKRELEQQLLKSQLAHLRGQLDQIRTTLEIRQEWDK